jgi:hypothetical protein
MARRVEYLQQEVRVLRETLTLATGKTRIVFTPEQRRRLAIKGRALTPEERDACCPVVRPSTILAWFRQLATAIEWPLQVQLIDTPHERQLFGAGADGFVVQASPADSQQLARPA